MFSFRDETIHINVDLYCKINKTKKKRESKSNLLVPKNKRFPSGLPVIILMFRFVRLIQAPQGVYYKSRVIEPCICEGSGVWGSFTITSRKNWINVRVVYWLGPHRELNYVLNLVIRYIVLNKVIDLLIILIGYW